MTEIKSLELGEIRTFEFAKIRSKEGLEECKLKDQKKFYVTKLQVRQGKPFGGYPKGTNSQGVMRELTYTYFAALDQAALEGNDGSGDDGDDGDHNEEPNKDEEPNEILGGAWISRAVCTPGVVGCVETIQTWVNARQCGLAKLLTYLCMADNDFHKIKGNRGFDFIPYLTIPSWKGIDRVQTITELYCDMVIYLEVGAWPVAASSGYMMAAYDAGFRRLITFRHECKIFRPHKNPDNSYFPNLFAAQENFKRDPVHFIYENGKHWFFCKKNLKRECFAYT